MTLAADWRLVTVTGVAAGLALSPVWTPDGSWIQPVVAVALAALLLVDRGRVGPTGLVLVGAAAALAGLLVGSARLDSIADGALRASPGQIAISGFVTEPPSDSGGVARFALDSEDGRVLVEAPSAETEGLVPGTGVDLDGRLGWPPDWLAGDLERRGIRMVLRADRISLNGNHRGGVTGLVDRLRNRAFAALAVAMPEREAALARGFVLGDDSDIDERTVEDFRRSGLSHLLAVSGQNIVLLALLAIPFLSLLGIGPRARLVAIAALILIYIPLAGGGPSIQRAGVMGIAGLVAVAATSAPSRVYALGLAAAVTLGLNPRATADIGWQLSFAAVIGIMLLARPLQIRLAPFIGTSGWRKALAEGAAVTLAATISTAPLVAFHFERLPVGTVFANLLAMPAVAPAMWTGMFSVGFGQISQLLVIPANLAGSVFLAWIAQVAEWFGRPGWAELEVKIDDPLTLGFVALLVGAIVVAGLQLWRPGRSPVRPGRWLPATAALTLCLLLLLPWSSHGRRTLEPPPPGGARVDVLDIGQGDATLIRPWNADPVLIDGGPPGGDLEGALESAGVERLAAVLLTHPDLDHYGGLFDVFGLTPVERFLFDKTTPELLSAAREAGAGLDRISTGEVIRTGDIRLEILWPPADAGAIPVAGDDTDTNLRSIVALLEWRGFRMLLTGDAEAEAVPMDPGPVDVLRVPHHGSRDTGLPALLDKSSPRMAVISVGEDNTYGHPVPEVLGELEESGVETLRTDEQGTVSIVLDRDGWKVETGE